MDSLHYFNPPFWYVLLPDDRCGIMHSCFHEIQSKGSAIRTVFLLGAVLLHNVSPDGHVNGGVVQRLGQVEHEGADASRQPGEVVVG